MIRFGKIAVPKHTAKVEIDGREFHTYVRTGSVELAFVPGYESVHVHRGNEPEQTVPRMATYTVNAGGADLEALFAAAGLKRHPGNTIVWPKFDIETTEGEPL